MKILFQNVSLVTTVHMGQWWPVLFVIMILRAAKKKNLVKIQWLNDELGSEFWSMNIIDKPGSEPRQPEGTFPHNKLKITFLIQKY